MARIIIKKRTSARRTAEVDALRRNYDESEQKGSVLIGFAWACLCFVAAFIVGRLLGFPTLGGIVGIVLALGFAHAKEGWRGFAGALVLVAVVFMLWCNRAVQDQQRKMIDEYFKIKYGHSYGPSAERRSTYPY